MDVAKIHYVDVFIRSFHVEPWMISTYIKFIASVFMLRGYLLLKGKFV